MNITKMIQYNAYEVIRHYWGEENVRELATKISDLLITCPEVEMSFAAKVMPMAVSEDELKGYQAKIGNSMLLRGAPKVPVVIIKVDEETSEAALGIVLYFEYGTPTVEREIRFIPMDAGNKGRIIEEMKVADKVIRYLDIANCKVIKTIFMPVKQQGREYMARLVYARDLSLSYSMVSHEEMTDSERFEYILKGIDESDYPRDGLDIGMLEAVKNQGYDNAKMRSQLLLFSSELRDLRKLYNRPSTVVNFIIVPDLSSCPALPNGFPLKDFNVDMFIDTGDENVYHDHHFSLEISLESVKDYYDFSDGLRTMTPIKKFLGM